MDKIEHFKSFVKTKPFLAYKVHSGLTNWQKLYEIYDVYGENHEIFNNGEKAKVKEEEPKATSSNEKTETSVFNGFNFAALLKTIQDIDTEKLMDNVNSFRKIFALFEKPKVSNPVNQSKTYKRFED